MHDSAGLALRVHVDENAYGVEEDAYNTDDVEAKMMVTLAAFGRAPDDGGNRDRQGMNGTEINSIVLMEEPPAAYRENGRQQDMSTV
jgi:hypothetical protein